MITWHYSMADDAVDHLAQGRPRSRPSRFPLTYTDDRHHHHRHQRCADGDGHERDDGLGERLAFGANTAVVIDSEQLPRRYETSPPGLYTTQWPRICTLSMAAWRRGFGVGEDRACGSSPQFPALLYTATIPPGLQPRAFDLDVSGIERLTLFAARRWNATNLKQHLAAIPDRRTKPHLISFPPWLFPMTQNRR